MRRSVLVFCVLGSAFLIVGSVLAVPSVRNGFSWSIPTYGRIGPADESSGQVSGGTSLDSLGYAVILLSVGFFAAAFLRNKRLI